MKVFCIIKTISFLKFEQVYFRILRKLFKPVLKKHKAPDKITLKGQAPTIRRPKILIDNKFCFNNIIDSFNNWNDLSNGLSWAYSLNCMDWLEQNEIKTKDCTYWIDSFINNEGSNIIGLDPYPTAIRCMNWMKFFIFHPELATEKRLDSLYSQLIMLSKNLERHILANHIMEDVITLYVGAYIFNDKKLNHKATKFLKRELKRQILPDGAHFEQSPTYHCVMTERLLDCINLTSDKQSNTFDMEMNQLICNKAKQMIGHLKKIVWNDLTIPMLNDSHYGSEPEPSLIFDYASRLKIDNPPINMKDCGYRKMKSDRMELILDIGNITATYQPGHSHADTFSYEMRIDCKPFIVDTGCSTYDKNKRRDYERGTFAHNTVIFGNKNSSEVWGGFRIASRAFVAINTENENYIEASHNGYGKRNIHTRSFEISNNIFTIKDHCTGKKETLSIIHFSPDTKIISSDNVQITTEKATIKFKGALSISIIDTEVSVEFNKLQQSKTAVISFRKDLVQTIVI